MFLGFQLARIMQKLDRLAELVVSSHREEIANVDAESSALARKLEEIAAAMGDDAGQAEQAARLIALAKSLDSIAQPP